MIRKYIIIPLLIITLRDTCHRNQRDTGNIGQTKR